MGGILLTLKVKGVVEDYEDTREFMKFLLQDYGFDVAEATNGYEAIEAVNRQVPDLILMDISMPGMDGLEATRELRRREEKSGTHLVVVAMTATETGTKLFL